MIFADGHPAIERADSAVAEAGDLAGVGDVVVFRFGKIDTADDLVETVGARLPNGGQAKTDEGHYDEMLDHEFPPW
jgi:hypothetical protein